jgi:hypothetical protein
LVESKPHIRQHIFIKIRKLHLRPFLSKLESYI